MILIVLLVFLVFGGIIGFTLGYFLGIIRETSSLQKLFIGDRVQWQNGSFLREGQFIRWENGLAVVHDSFGNVEMLSPTISKLKKIESK